MIFVRLLSSLDHPSNTCVPTAWGASRRVATGALTKLIAAVIFNIQPWSQLLAPEWGSGLPGVGVAWSNFVGICFFHVGNCIDAVGMIKCASLEDTGTRTSVHVCDLSSILRSQCVAPRACRRMFDIRSPCDWDDLPLYTMWTYCVAPGLARMQQCPP